MSQQNTDMLDGLQAIVLSDAQKKKNEKHKDYSFDPLAMYFREDLEIAGIKVVQPSVGDILSITEPKFYSGLSPILYNSTSIRVMLWDVGIDWCKIHDIEVFDILSKIPNMDFSALRLIFPDCEIEKMQLVKMQKPDSDESQFALYDAKKDFLLEESDYNAIAEYIRTILNVHPKIEKAKGKLTKEWMIDEDRMIAAQKEEKDESTLLPLVSACVNHPGFKYKLQELRKMGIYEFMDSVQRLQVYESSRALMAGSYSGFCDTSKIPKEQFNFMRELHD